MAEVVNFPGEFRSGIRHKRRDLEPLKVLEGLSENVNELDLLLVAGIDKDGKLYAACSSFDTADALLLLERLKRKLLAVYGTDEWRG